MTHMRYWLMTLASAICGAFIAIDRFAFAANTAKWIAFGVAIGATVFSLEAFFVALVRENHTFSGLSALNVLIGGWTIIAMLVFIRPAALWLGFADGLALLVIALRGLALHETTIERVVHALELGAPLEPALQATPTTITPPTTVRPGTGGSLRPQPTIGAPMGAWMSWLSQTAVMLAGAFVVLMTFALRTASGHTVSLRWLAFGIGIVATCLALGSLLGRGLLRDTAVLAENGAAGRRAELMLTCADAAVGVAVIVTMIVYSGNTARWLAFALGCGLVGFSLLASLVHEVTSERVRHELEIAEPAPSLRAGPTPMPAA